MSTRHYEKKSWRSQVEFDNESWAAVIEERCLCMRSSGCERGPVPAANKDIWYPCCCLVTSVLVILELFASNAFFRCVLLVLLKSIACFVCPLFFFSPGRVYVPCRREKSYWIEQKSVRCDSVQTMNVAPHITLPAYAGLVMSAVIFGQFQSYFTRKSAEGRNTYNNFKIHTAFLKGATGYIVL